MPEDRLPESLAINAWTGDVADAASPPSRDIKRWGTRPEMERKQFLAGEEADPRNWQNEDVGWGILLPENEELSVAERAEPTDAPEPIQLLWRVRQRAPVFRYRGDLEEGFLRRYYTDGSRQDISVFGDRGTGRGRCPRYLLIVGSPAEIPWRAQYSLNGPCYVGRLDLPEAGLENYVRALIDDWREAACRSTQPVVWSTNQGREDITWLMRGAIAKPVAEDLEADEQVGAELRFLTDENASRTKLAEALEERHPAFVLTTSHGKTGPLDDHDVMAAELGWLVDHEGALVSPDSLAGWQPDGAVWYAHACCSAGCDGQTAYRGLVSEGSSVERILEGVAKIGPRTSPLPTALLSAEKPLRAFIGHVEPTFDWTLREPTGQVITSSLKSALYPGLHLRRPKTVGMALERYYGEVGTLFRKLEQLRERAAALEPGTRTSAVRTRLTARDRESLVILGDPTVSVPPMD